MGGRCSLRAAGSASIMACTVQRLTFYVLDGELPPAVAGRAEAAARVVLDAAGVAPLFAMGCDDVICTYSELDADWMPTAQQVVAADAWVDAHCAAVDLAAGLGWPLGSLTCWPAYAEAARREWASRHGRGAQV